ncbi:MAG: ribulose-phosphate 3-epimerase [Acidimicrobiia bacterium]|nr:ribulose-phosphate 3-epimerase [Acidimicrobiia bacterium]MDH5236007.1 ribulose-phosphate 3-epimerase [Acidimicrobiia bacterium]
MSTNRPIAISPSVLSADFAKLGDECLALEKAGADRIHWDVMDGVFVPNLTIGPPVIAAVRPLVATPFEAHLMVVKPDHLLGAYAEAGCQTLIVHAEACDHLHRTLAAIADLGMHPAVSLNPHTPVEAIVNVLDMVDLVLIMTVNPGFGGQRYIASMEPKIRRLRSLIVERDLDIDIEVDGGVSAATVTDVVTAGANVLVSGSALFGDDRGLEPAIAALRGAAVAAQT